MGKIALILVLSFILSGCGSNYPISKSGDKYTLDSVSMDTYVNITAYGKNAEKALESSYIELERMDLLFSVRNPESPLYKLNADKEYSGNSELSSVISRSLRYSELTEGAFDITVYPLMRAWGFDTGAYTVPDEKELYCAIQKTGYKNILVNDDKIVLNNGAEIDLGGIAKGYASDVISAILTENEVSSAIISLGGNICAVGRRQNGEPWSVAVESPFSEGEHIGVLKVFDASVVTSGGYRRFFEKDGKKYHHIIDMKTGYPSEKGIASVTVITGSGMYADALSTAIYTMGIEEGLALREKCRDFELVIVGKDKTVYATEGLKKTFELADDNEYRLVWR